MPVQTINEKQARFCLYYLQSFNVRAAAARAGYKRNYVYEMMKKPYVKAYLDEQKELMRQQLWCESLDVLKLYEAMAFSDMTDFLEFGTDGEGAAFIRLLSSDKVDGRIIEELGLNAQGVPRLRLCDRFRALEKLERFFDLLPDAWKRRIEEEKLRRSQGAPSVVNVITSMPVPEGQSG